MPLEWGRLHAAPNSATRGMEFARVWYLRLGLRELLPTSGQGQPLERWPLGRLAAF